MMYRTAGGSHEAFKVLPIEAGLGGDRSNVDRRHCADRGPLLWEGIAVADLVLTPEVSALISSMIASLAAMQESRKVQPGGFLLSPSAHSLLASSAHLNGIGSDPRSPEKERTLLGYPYRIVAGWQSGWVLANNRAWAELRQPG